MSLDRDIAILRRVPLFADFSAEQIRLLAFSAENRNLGTGEKLFAEGERGDSGYVVVTGAIELTKATGDGPLTEARVGAGTLIGELALVIDVERPVTATAAEPAEIMRIRRTVFHRMMAEYPEIAVSVRNRFAERLAATSGNLERVGHRLTRHDR